MTGADYEEASRKALRLFEYGQVIKLLYIEASLARSLLILGNKETNEVPSDCSQKPVVFLYHAFNVWSPPPRGAVPGTEKK